MKTQTGFALLETAAAIGILAICASALALAAGSAAKLGAHANGPHRTAAFAFAGQTVRIAQDAWKYGALASAPAGSADVTLRIPGPDGVPTSMPARVSAAIAPDDQGASISVTVAYTPDPGRDDPGTVTIRARLRELAPLPGTKIEQSGLIPQP